MTPEAADPLAALRDIRLPLEPGWWPPAPGWWLLAAMVLVVAGLLIRYWWRGRPRRLARRQAHRELDALAGSYRLPAQSAAFLAALSALLRRGALHAGHRDAAGLCARDWAEFLTRHGSATAPRAHWELVALGAYRPDVAVDDPQALIESSRQWLEREL